MSEQVPKRSAGFMLHDVSRLMGKRFEQLVRARNDCGLTRAQYKTLAYLRHNEGMPQSALAEMLEIEPITLTRLIDRLEEADMVERRPHQSDRRAWRLYLKDGALPILAELEEVAAQVRAESAEGLGEADFEHFLKVLETMKSNLFEACNARAAVKARNDA